jgi:hydroxyacylglutathione hydrolase
MIRSMLDVHIVPAFQDNYLWLAASGGEALVVDPGDAAPIEAALSRLGLRLSAILITHWHPDHIGGVEKLLESRAGLPVYGPRAENAKIRPITRPLDDGDAIEVLGQRFDVMAVPGHTLGHIAYYGAGSPPLLFCGDTLFSGGCGRLFEGTAAQMSTSLARLKALPPETRVYCAHEYPASNIAFALAVEPGNADLQAYAKRVKDLRAADTPTIPSTIALERRINPVLRTTAAEVRASAEAKAGQALADEVSVLATIRTWKDGFRPPANP